MKVLSICSQNSPQLKNIIISSFKFALADTIFFSETHCGEQEMMMDSK